MYATMVCVILILLTFKILSYLSDPETSEPHAKSPLLNANSESVLSYISGYLVRNIECNDCVLQLCDSREKCEFLELKKYRHLSKNPLIHPSALLKSHVEKWERIFQRHIHKVAHIKDIKRHFLQKLSSLSLPQICPVHEDVGKSIMLKFVNLRLHAYSTFRTRFEKDTKSGKKKAKRLNIV